VKQSVLLRRVPDLPRVLHAHAELERLAIRRARPCVRIATGVLPKLEDGVFEIRDLLLRDRLANGIYRVAEEPSDDVPGLKLECPLVERNDRLAAFDIDRPVYGSMVICVVVPVPQAATAARQSPASSNTIRKVILILYHLRI